MNNSRTAVRIVCIILAALFVIPLLIAAIASLTGCSSERAVPREDRTAFEELIEYDVEAEHLGRLPWRYEP